MAAVKSSNTRPEVCVRKYLFSKGFRYRINNRSIPGTPDIVLKKYKTAIFIDGCFWHGHEGCKLYRVPKSNVEFWTTKFTRNIERDRRTNRTLTEMGWTVIRIWECRLKTVAIKESTLSDLYSFLKDEILSSDNLRIYSPDKTLGIETTSTEIAAEPESPYGSDK